MARNSWLAEQRMTSAHFYQKSPADLIKMAEYNIVRIIKDIANDNIDDKDYVYFTAPNFLNACKIVTYNNYNSNRVIANALYNYCNYTLPNLQAYNPTTPDEMVLSQTQYSLASGRCSIWNIAYNAFCNISNDITNAQITGINPDPKYALSVIKSIDKRQLNIL